MNVTMMPRDSGKVYTGMVNTNGGGSGTMTVMVHFESASATPRSRQLDARAKVTGMTSKKDFTQVAYAVFQQAVGEVPKRAPSPKQEAGRKGGLKGGRTRADSMTPEQRKELALKAANARWAKKAPVPGEATGVRKR